ncbi:hypothetical protein [Steroidobacter sp.]|uniref:hypothetical protein n=1 Tax=Steroidobacter sp. TaxID=1978227 RepID=UPI001A48B7E1|nr:hypothetical protein [Steroidobacter sp.]MBL8266183.1 hypothetical protein [Steroidobacter sp.]
MADRLSQVWAVLAALGVSATAHGVEYQVHGYAAQGFVLSEDNDFFGDSTDGSFDYYEAGINAAVRVMPQLSFAVQGAVRDAGISDDGTARLDYAVADYRVLSEATIQAGVRAGKVKNALGFYNETRDVVFTRPSILLPSVYSDNQNQRSLIFTAPGAQVYASTVTGRHEWSFTGTVNAERNVRRSDERLLITLSVPFDLRIGDSWNVQLMDSIDGGRWQFSYSRFAGEFRLKDLAGLDLLGKFDVDLDVFSARFNAERVSVTAEYMLIGNDNRLTLGGLPLQHTRANADSGYLQAEYRFAPTWTLMARMDSFYRNRHDRSGREFAAANPGVDRRTQVSHDFTVGINWRPDLHWGVWAEHHWINGTATLQPLENPPPVREQRWSMFMLMAGYKF